MTVVCGLTEVNFLFTAVLLQQCWSTNLEMPSHKSASLSLKGNLSFNGWVSIAVKVTNEPWFIYVCQELFAKDQRISQYNTP